MPFNTSFAGSIAASFAAIATLATSASAAPVTYTSKAAFLAALPAGSYTNNFSSQTAFSGPLTSVTGSGGTPAVSYSIVASNPAGDSGLFINQDASSGPTLNAVGNYAAADSLVLSVTAGTAYAIGTDLYLTDIGGNRLAGTIAPTFSDGVVGTVPVAATGNYSFFGVIDTVPLTSLTLPSAGLNASNTSLFLNFTNLTVSGKQVPEPATLASIVLLGAAGVSRRRRGV